jgi:hypothetical protein
MTRVGIVLHEHEGNHGRIWRVGEFIREIALRNKVPITFSATGMTLDTLLRCCSDVSAGMRSDFANKNSEWDPNKPELVISTFNNNAVVLPLPLEYWGAYADGYSYEQIGKSRSISEHGFHRTPRGIFPPETMFAPAAARIMEKSALHYSFIAGEPFGDDDWARGQVYYVGDHDYGVGLKLLPRNNSIGFREFYNPSMFSLKEKIKETASGAHMIIVGWDLGHFTGHYRSEGREGFSFEDGVGKIHSLAQEIYSDPDLHLMNCGGIADSYWHPLKIYDKYRSMDIYDPHHYITTWMNGNGDLGSLNGNLGNMMEFVRWHTHSLGHCDGHWLQQRKEEEFRNFGMERMMHW